MTVDQAVAAVEATLDSPHLRVDRLSGAVTRLTVPDAIARAGHMTLVDVAG